MPEPTRKLAAIVFTDIVGYTKLASDNQSKASALLKQQRDLFQPIVSKFNGSWIKEVGDGLILTFDTVTDAVNCCIKLQDASKRIDDLDLRIGIHQGEILIEENDIIGDDVNIAARIEPFAAPGGIAISNKVNDALIREAEFTTKYLGKPKLKGVGQEVKVYCITSHGLPETDLSRVSAKLEPEGFQWNVMNSLGVAASMIGLFMLINFMFLRIGYADKDETPSIAILPFENKGAEEDEFYAYGISSDLITDVTGAGMIRVVSLKDIEKLDYGEMETGDLAKKLFVRYVAQGTLWKMDSVFQLSMEIFDTKESKVVYNKRWQTDWKDLATIKDDLSDNILETLEIQILQDSEIDRKINPDAYELYIKAKHKYEKRESRDDTEIVRELLKKAIELDDNLISAKLILGATYSNMGDYDKAMEIYMSALKQSDVLGDKRGMSNGLNNIGILHYMKNDYEKALDCLGKSFAIQEELGDKRGMGNCLNNIGLVHKIKNDYEKALDYYGRSLAIQEELGNKRGMSACHINIGIVHNSKGDYEKALDYYGRSLAIREELGDKRQMGYNLNNIGNVHQNKGDYEKALDYYSRSLAMQEEIGNKDGMAYSLHNIGNVHKNKGDYERTLDYYGRSLAIREEIGNNYYIVKSLNSIGIYYCLLGEYKKSISYLEKAIKLMQEEKKGEYEGDLVVLTYLYLSYKGVGKEYDENEINNLIKESEKISYELNFRLYELLEDKSYLETAYTQLLEQADAMDNTFKQEFLDYPIPRQIVEAWEKVQS